MYGAWDVEDILNYWSTEMSETFGDFVRQVGQWSNYNFGDQKGVGAFAPFTGISEELGELDNAIDTEDILDAFADIAVYFADFCYRANLLDLNLAWTLEEVDNGWALVSGSLTIAKGELAHVLLKTHQGIRNYADEQFAHDQLRKAATAFWYTLVEEFEEDPQLCDESFHETVWKVWSRVRDRDWKACPNTGAQDAEKTF